MNNAWENLNKTWRERLEKLEDAMQAAVQYQDTLQVRAESDHRGHTGAVVSLSVVSGSPSQDCSILKPEVLVLYPSQFSTSNEEGSDIRSLGFLPCFPLHAYPIIYPHGGYRVKLALLSKSLLVRNSKPRLSWSTAWHNSCSTSWAC